MKKVTAKCLTITFLLEKQESIKISTPTHPHKECEFNGTSTHLLEFKRLYQCQSKIYSTLLSKITKNNQRHRELNRHGTLVIMA